MRRWRLALVAAFLCGCAATRPLSEPAPDSAHLGATLGWTARGAPVYDIAVVLPRGDLRPVVEAGRVHLVLSAQATSPSGATLGGQAWTRQLDASELDVPGDVHWCVTLGTASGPQTLALTVLVQGRAFGLPWHRRFEVPVPELDALVLGEPVFLRAATDSACNAIHVGRYYDAETGPPRVQVTVYDFAARDTAFALAWVVRDLDAARAVVATETLHVASRGAVTAVVWDLPALPLGRQELELRLHGARRAAATRGRFEIGLADLGGLGASDAGIDLIALLLSRAEADSLQRVAPEAREALWNELWARHDPVPTTPENEARDAALARVRDANLRFGGARAGWRTDRGRVYIARGAPDAVDTLANAEGFDRIERWTYTQSNIVFVFVDRDGGGEYTLLRTNARDF